MFLDQESEGIIEGIDVWSDDFNNYILIPHKPVIKKDPVCITNIRPVSNCSLWTGSRPSINDCVYPGVNLFTDKWDLLSKFWCNRFVLLADVHKEIDKLSKGDIRVKLNCVNTNDNPVGLIIRGVSPDKLKQNSYFGFMVLPGWLLKPYNGLPVSWAVLVQIVVC